MKQLQAITTILYFSLFYWYRRPVCCYAPLCASFTLPRIGLSSTPV